MTYGRWRSSHTLKSDYLIDSSCLGAVRLHICELGV
ncbi:MAG: hypothetical protein KDD84_20445 [Caldilineaceae bacterium]|nr:hypothetical protein [Caldilineaceae bacterium]MCB2013857.1 hypothetical protein [Sphingobium sp.]MCP5398954.1 hypothetical protein [Sphingomonas sp.]